MTREEISLIIGMMLVTFIVRYPVLAAVGKVRLPERALRGLRFVPVALLSAIIAPELLIRDGVPALTLANAYLIGGLAALLVAWRWGNLLLTILAGMGSFLLWRALVAAI
ncbi:MAG: AzlD domain-containing protein [Chloroflexi bacterium]|nr:AzlD domain-containing protein [Chloroflexota bacterium]